jgi:hypothetical protein
MQGRRAGVCSIFLCVVIYNIPHPSLILHIHDQATRNTLLLLIQEVKRDIIYRRMNLPQSARQPTDPWRIKAHIDSAIKRLRSYLEYIGFVKFTKAITTLQRLQELNLAWGVPCGAPCLRLRTSMTHPIHPMPTLSYYHMCALCTLSTAARNSRQ